MSRIGLLTIAFLVLLPVGARGVSLEWAGGARNLDVSASARRCTLLVTPSAGEPVLPARWRLYWTGTSEVDGALQFLMQPGPAGASVCGLRPAADDAERLTHASTVEFCGPVPEQPTGSAAYVLLVDPSLRARLLAVGESGVGAAVASNEVTVNGGSAEEYPAALRFVAPLEDSAGIRRAGVVGQGMDRVRKAWLYASAAEAPLDSLAILTQTATQLTVRMPGGTTSGTTLLLSNGAGEPATGTDLTDVLGYNPQTVGAARMNPPYPIEPKDFAFLKWNGVYHLFYMWVDGTVPDSLSATSIRHAVSTNLYNWTQLSPALTVRPGKFDSGHLWAPTVLEQGGTFFMFYTAVTKDTLGGEGVQRIGRATSTDLDNWTREDQPVFTCGSVPWSYCSPADSRGRQFRDPFVMVDPADATHALMYYVTRLGTDADQQVVGVADTHDPAGGWANLTPMWCTDKYPNNFLGFNESPHVFSHNGLWYLMLTTNSTHPIRFKTAPGPLSDSTLWSGQYRLYDETGQDGNSDFWIASESLHSGAKDYLAVVNRAAAAPAIEIREMNWTTAPHFTLGTPPVTAVAEATPPPGVDLRWASGPGSRDGVALEVRLPAPGLARVELFDVLGRSVARLSDGWLPAGTSRWTWDGRLQTGDAAGSGIYFARVRTSAASRTIRVALLR